MAGVLQLIKVQSHVRRHHQDLNESVAVVMFQHRTIGQEFICTCMYSQNLKKQTAPSSVRRSKQNQRGLRPPAAGQLLDQNSVPILYYMLMVIADGAPYVYQAPR